MTFPKPYKALILAITTCAALALSSSVNAQQIDLTVTPPTLEIFIKPDTQVSIPYAITNRADTVSLKPLVRTFFIEKEGKTVLYGSTERLPIKTSFVDENSEAIDTFTVNKGDSKKIFLQLDVPAAITEGDYQLSFIVETQPEFSDRQYSARLKSQIASPILITVTKTGRTEVRGEVSEFKIAGSVFDSFDAIPITLSIKNLGKNAFSASGNLTVRGSLGENANYPLQNRNIHSNSERLMTTKLAKDGKTLVLKGFFIGRYGVSASVLLADGTVQLNKSTSFFVFPFKIVLFAVLGSFIGIMVLRKMR